MTSCQAVGEELLGAEQMGQIGAREVAAEQAAAAFLDRPRVVHELGVAHVEAAAGDPQLAVAGDSGRQDGVEQVDAAMDGLEQVRRRAQAHQVARPRIVRRSRSTTTSSAASRWAGVSSPARPPMQMPSNGRLGHEPRRLRPKVRIEAALDDAEERLVRSRVGGERALGPAMRPSASPRRRPRGSMRPAAPAGRRRRRCRRRAPPGRRSNARA